jgi:uncharacterized alpha-E superfamily protein
MYESPHPLLLSRTAESAYWAGRYLERAEGTARLIKTHADLIIDLPRTANVGWGPLLAVVGIDPGFARNHPQATEEIVVGHLAADPENPSSVRSSIASVHHNLRVTRTVMPIEAAEVLNELHNHVQATSHQAVDRRTRGSWLNSVMRGTQTLWGILADNMSHDDAFCFFTIGRQLERIDLTARVIDVQASVLTGRTDEALAPFQDLSWTAALRSVSALQAFRRRGVSSTAEATLAFLIHDPKCPRTIEACMIEASRWLLEIPGHEPTMAAFAEAEAMLHRVDIDDLVGNGLHSFADRTQLAVADLHNHIESTWFAPAHTAVAR